jgi:hypothetical protein
MVGATANAAVSTRRLAAAATAAAEYAPGLASPRAAAVPGGTAAAAGEVGLSAAAGVPSREGAAATGALGLAAIPGGRPPVHMSVLAGEADLPALGPPTAGPAVTIALPQAGQRMTGCIAPDLAAGSGA